MLSSSCSIVPMIQIQILINISKKKTTKLNKKTNRENENIFVIIVQNTLKYNVTAENFDF